MLLLASTVDLLPNGLFTNHPYLLAGAVLGLARGLRRPAPDVRDAVPTMPQP
jgi:hypothetical protein